MDRNVDALIQELAIRCQRVFARAAGAAARCAVVSFGPSSPGNQAAGARLPPQPSNRLFIRERIIKTENEVKFLP